MSVRRAADIGLLLLALGVLVALAPTASAEGHGDLPPIMPQDIDANPDFQNVTADTDRMTFTIQLRTIQEGYTGDFRVDLEIQNETIGVIEDVWPPGTKTMNVSTDEDADEGPGYWSPSVGLHPFNLTVEADGKSFPLDFRLPAGPDVSLTSADAHGENATADVTTTPARPKPGDDVTFHVNVTNKGSWATPEGQPVPVTLTLNGEQLGERSFQDLGAGNTTTLAFEDAWTAEAGHHTLEIVADRGAIEEVLDGNNENTYPFTVQDPGLAVQSLTAEPDPAEPNETVTLEATILNEASERENASLTAFYRDGQHLDNVDTPALDPGETTTITHEVQLPAGEHTFTALPDATEDAPPKPPEDPGSATVQLLVGAKVNLTETRTQPAHPTEGDNVTVTGTIENHGTRLDEPLPVALIDRRNGSTVAQTNVTGLGAGQPTTFDLELSPAVGDHSYVVALDPDLTVDGLVREHDQALVSFTVREEVPELVVERLALANASLLPGDQAPAQVTVANEGNATVSDLVARFTMDGEPLGSDVSLEELAPGENRTVESRSWTAAPGDHELAVEVGSPHDLAAGSPLASETTTVSVTEAEHDLAIGELRVEPEPPAPGDEVRLAIDVTNEGEVATPAFEVHFEVDGDRIGIERVDGLQPGETRTVHSPNWTLEAGTNETAAIVDPEGAVLDTEDGRRVAHSLPDARADAPAPGLAGLLAALGAACLAATRRER